MREFVFDVNGQWIFPCWSKDGGLLVKQVAYAMQERGPDDVWAQAIFVDSNNLKERECTHKDVLGAAKLSPGRWEKVIDGKLPNAV